MPLHPLTRFGLRGLEVPKSSEFEHVKLQNKTHFCRYLSCASACFLMWSGLQAVEDLLKPAQGGHIEFYLSILVTHRASASLLFPKIEARTF